MEIRPELFLTFRGHVGLGGIVELLGVSNTFFVGWRGRGVVGPAFFVPSEGRVSGIISLERGRRVS